MNSFFKRTSVKAASVLASTLFLAAFSVAQVSAETVGCGDPEADNWLFIGCSRSHGDCYNSCNPRGNFKTEVEPELCMLDVGADYACYCPKPGSRLEDGDDFLDEFEN